MTLLELFLFVCIIISCSKIILMLDLSKLQSFLDYEALTCWNLSNIRCNNWTNSKAAWVSTVILIVYHHELWFEKWELQNVPWALFIPNVKRNLLTNIVDIKLYLNALLCNGLDFRQPQALTTCTMYTQTQ